MHTARVLLRRPLNRAGVNYCSTAQISVSLYGLYVFSSKKDLFHSIFKHLPIFQVVKHCSDVPMFIQFQYKALVVLMCSRCSKDLESLLKIGSEGGTPKIGLRRQIFHYWGSAVPLSHDQ